MYDLGFAVHDKQGNIYETYSLVIADVYCNEKEIMQSAYYSRKLPQYEEDLKTGKRKLVSVETAKRILSEIAKNIILKQLLPITQDLIIGAQLLQFVILQNQKIVIFCLMKFRFGILWKWRKV